MFKFQRQRAEKPSDRTDFKFLQFEATKVPVNCDKLLVTIISVETGKAVARTNKALVRSGSCQWSEAVSESVRFLQDETSKELEEKLFKFVVSTGSPRSGIVGEATINLADYWSSKAPVPLSLPLKKCNHGTILHVKIHCLNPRVGSRQTEHLRESSVEQDDQNSVSDDMDNRSEGSDHIIGGSAGSSSGNRLGRGGFHNKLTKLQDRNLSPSHQEHELLSKLRDQEQLQKEVEKLQKANKQLLSQLSRFKETTKSGDILDRVVALETELAEALESNAMYKSQLQSFLSQEQNVHAAALQNFGTVDQVVNDLTRFKRTTSSLETELKDLRERYFRMSLQFAEVEAQREELVMQIKNLKSGKKWF